MFLLWTTSYGPPIWSTTEIYESNNMIASYFCVGKPDVMQQTQTRGSEWMGGFFWTWKSDFAAI